MDLSKLSESDLQALASGDMSKVSDEGLSHLAGEPTEAKPPATGVIGKLNQMADAAPDWLKNAMGAQHAFRGKLLESGTLGNITAQMQPGVEEATKQHPYAAMAGAAAGTIAPAALGGEAAGALSEGAGLAGRVAVGSGQGGLAGFLAKPQEKDSVGTRIDQAKRGLMAGGLFTAGQEAASAAGNKLADFLMQKAVGRTKYAPGVGNTLVDEGLVGTKGMLKDQVTGKIASRGKELEQAVESIPGHIDSKDIADKVNQLASRYVTPGGDVPLAVMPEVDAITQRAGDIAGRGLASPLDALKYKRIAATEGYKNGAPLASFNAGLAKTETNAYGKALEDAYGAVNQGAPNQVESLNKTLSALYKANKGLNTESSMARGLPLTDIALGGAGAALGAASDPEHRAAGALKGVLLSRALKSSAVQSGSAQALQKLSALAADPAVRQLILDTSTRK